MTQFTLPPRSGNAPKIGETIPQLQFSDLSPDEVRTKLWDWAFSNFEDVSEEDIKELDKLGFIPCEEYGEGFVSFRFGSC